ncbi:unnamed protein product [Penicillium salamii]|uniref:Uncharacterized protein n=1 Tax=Penicillium salamii TaxID=1612424 RepID=A0A9W4I1G0_9EURO|nr:unnamed protein product [Penicillium salamii]CAG8360977.1 unnamed protein product [Penicillium salamii]CAG8362718.1 unnamed protein product [Penicillium salamii]CAG8369201.1 unnamed protein product [Penicillium salamii]
MPRPANLRTGSTGYEYGQLRNNDTAYGKRDVADCKFPSIPKKADKTSKRNAIWGIIGTASFLMVGFMGVAIAFTVMFAVKSLNFRDYRPGNPSPDSPEYALYKNTRFEECYSTRASTANCAAILVALKRTGINKITGFGDNNLGYLGSNTVFDEGSRSISDWCEAMSCFNDYKVIPSTIRDSAIWPNLLTSWTASAGFVLGSLVQLCLQQKALYSKRNMYEPCKGLGDVHWYSWPFIVIDLCSFIWWWILFGKLVAAPESAATPFIVGWVIPWKYAGQFRYHPFSCAFRKNRRGQMVIRWTFYILAAIQWIASLYVIHVNFPSGLSTSWGLRAPNPSYDCVQSQIEAAPGASTCSATQICSRNWLFVDPGFEPAYQHSNSIIAIGIMFLALTLTALSPLAMMAFACFQREKSPGLSPRSMLRWSDPGPIAILSILSLFEIIVGCILVDDIVKRLGVTPDAAVIFDWECQAIHVALSPWRYYIDVHYEQGWRIAKMWFNS